jgi:uncharacterized protein YyaL (SSP411 family)
MKSIFSIFLLLFCIGLSTGCGTQNATPLQPLQPLQPQEISSTQTQDTTVTNPNQPAQSASIKPHKFTNALARETSPYLLQHAHNPVNWYPWGNEAFAKARAENKPIFLSVGYSSCHWCHVMERESFENENVAKVLNDSFVCIKVDREERPDVDEIYMTAVQFMTQRGGWPMSVFMTADGRPFFGGTYFPTPHFVQLLERIHKVWTTQHDALLVDANRLGDAVKENFSRPKLPASGSLGMALTENFIEKLSENFDRLNGGFGSRPKFPPNNALPLMIYLQQQTTLTPESTKEQKEQAELIARMTVTTLDKLAQGGIHDQIAGGFHRYSTDAIWLVPHFEKMLYDNALLSRSYAQASVVYSSPEYARVARDVYEWVLREMTSPEGGFYSSLDADSEGHEGKFYVWKQSEIISLLGSDAELFCDVYTIRNDGNFMEEATGAPTKLNIPHLVDSLRVLSERLKIKEDMLRTKLDLCRTKLLAARNQRIWPALDDKILTSWNGLMISSFARGSICLKEPRYLQAALKCAEFLLQNLRTPEGRWLATYRKDSAQENGQSKHPAYLDDHAFLAVAFLDLFEATHDERWKNEALALVETMDKHFADPTGGAYYFTADDHEKLLARTKDPIDKAIPSGNGWAAQALVRLAKITGKNHYANKAHKLFSEFHGLMERAPEATESLLLAVAEFYTDPILDPKLSSLIGTGIPTVLQAKIQRGPVIAELISPSNTLKAGTSTKLTLRLTMDESWHILAGNSTAEKSEKAEGATRVTLQSKTLGTLDKVVYPASKDLKIAAINQTVQVYEGSIDVELNLTVAPDAPRGKQPLSVKVYFQACNDKVCDKPEEVLLGVAMEVVVQ